LNFFFFYGHEYFLSFSNQLNQHGVWLEKSTLYHSFKREAKVIKPSEEDLLQCSFPIKWEQKFEILNGGGSSWRVSTFKYID